MRLSTSLLNIHLMVLLFELQKCWVYRARTAKLQVSLLFEKEINFDLKWKHCAFKLKRKKYVEWLMVLWCWYNSSLISFPAIWWPYFPSPTGILKCLGGWRAMGKKTGIETRNFIAHIGSLVLERIVSMPLTFPTPLTSVSSSTEWGPFYLHSTLCCKTCEFAFHKYEFPSLLFLSKVGESSLNPGWSETFWPHGPQISGCSISLFREVSLDEDWKVMYPLLRG